MSDIQQKHTSRLYFCAHVFLGILGLIGSGCETDKTINSSPTTDQGQCPSERRPLVLVHGFLASGDTWSRHTQRLINSGSCPKWIRTYDWNSLDMAGDQSEGLDQLIDDLLKLSELDQVDLIGHSAGGGVSYRYLSDTARAAKIHKYVHVGSFPEEAPPSPAGEEPIQMLNLWSSSDRTVEGADIEGATNVTLSEEDHYAVATSEQSYREIVRFLYAEEVTSDDTRPAPRETGELDIGGRVLTLGENQPLSNTVVQIWSVDENGRRSGEVLAVTTDEAGIFQAPALPAGKSLEFAPIQLENTSPPVRYFLPPLVRNDPLIYLRTFPSGASIASILVNQLPRDEERVSLVVFSAHRALLAGVDSLLINGQEALTTDIASAEDTTIALFIFDVGADGEGGGSLPLFDRFPFLAGLDLPLRANPEEKISVVLNGDRVVIPASSAAEGTLIVTFP